MKKNKTYIYKKMSYQERLNNFNQSVTQANDHVARLRDTLANPELKANPVRMGLDMANQVLGTGAGLARIRQHMMDGSETRAVLSANYNKFGQIKDAINNLPTNLNSATNETINRAQGSISSQIADGSKAPSNIVQSIVSGENNPANVTPNITDEIDGGIRSRISNLPQAPNTTQEASNISRSIDNKLNSSLNPAERSNLNQLTSPTFADRVNEVNQIDNADPAKLAGQQNLLQIKNSMANDAIARKQQNIPSAEGYDETGRPINPSAATGSSNTETNILGATSAQDSTGIASTGENAGRNALAQGTGSLPSLPNPSNVGGNVNAPDLVSNVKNAQGDISSVAQSASNDVNQGASIVSRGQNLGLSQANIPSQSGQGSISGLATSANSNNPSAAANMVSQAQQGNADAHTNASSATNQTSANSSTQSSGTEAPDASSNPSTTAGAATADDAATGTNNGIKAALGAEETLDEVAPEVPAIGTVLEAGSLLATLGTGIASLFEPEEKKSSPPPSPKVGAPIQVAAGSLKNNAAGAVGAF